MAVVTPYSLERAVREEDCGDGGTLGLRPLVGLFHDAAWHHAASLGFGVGHLQQAGRTWMLSRLEVRLDDPPRPGDRVVVETWPSGLERLFAMRDFALRAADGRVLARGIYAYLIVDVAGRRPVRPDRHARGDWPTSELPHAIPDFSLKVPRSEGLEPAFRERAAARHLDDNGHVNNIHLIGWLTEAVPRGLRGAGTPALVRVEFLREILEGEALEASWARRDDGVVTELQRAGEPLARAFTLWKP